MTWSVGRDAFLELCEVMDLVPSRPGIHSSEYFCVDSKKGSPTFAIASEVTGNVLINGNGRWPMVKPFYLDRRVFLPFVFAAKDLTDAPFVFSRKKKELIVRQGSRKAVFTSQEKVDGYGQPPQAEMASTLELGDKLRGLIYCARDCAADDPVTPQLNCVYIQPNSHSVSVLATNQKILFRGAGIAKGKIKHAVPFPLYLVRLLGSDKLKEVQWYKKYVALVFRHGKIWQAVSAKALRDFPVKPIRQHMEKTAQGNPVLQVSSKKLSRALNRLCVYLSAVRRQDWSLLLIGKKGTRKLLVRSVAAGSVFNERVRLKKPLPLDLKLEWPLAMMEPVFQFLSGMQDTVLEVRCDKKGRSYMKARGVELVIPRRRKE